MSSTIPAFDTVLAWGPILGMTFSFLPDLSILNENQSVRKAMYRFIVHEGDDYYTYVGEVVAWGPETITLKSAIFNEERRVVSIEVASIVESDVIAA
jgi:hypothetical protein